MKKGFTILELLVASLLLGMLVTILTMIFNQSSIAWRTGVAGVADLDGVRGNMAVLRDEADTVYPWNGQMYRLVSPWDNETGELRGNGSGGKRAISVDDTDENARFMAGKGLTVTASTRQRNFTTVNVGAGDAGGAIKTYIVNVKSAGPDRRFDTWDDIWSYPDDFE